jgi:hypothetical protein
VLSIPEIAIDGLRAYAMKQQTPQARRFLAMTNPNLSERVRDLEAELETRKQAYHKAMSRWYEPIANNIDGSEQQRAHKMLHDTATAYHVAERDLAVARDMLDNGSTEEEAIARFPLSAFIPTSETDHEGQVR